MTRLARAARRLALVVLALAPAMVHAQRPAPRPTTQPTRPIDRPPPAPAGPRDSARAAGDTTPRELVQWAEEDSVMRALLARPGFSATRYQGDKVTFGAADRVLILEGRPSAVQRGPATLVGDTIVYNDSLDVVQVRSDSAILRDPTYQQADVVARRFLEYDLTRRIGTVREVSTAIESGQRWFVHGTGGAQFRNDTSAARRSAFYVRNGEITSCEHDEPHYHFAASEIKVVARNVLVARPAVLYIGRVPVMWLPFIFQDLRSGRRSGLTRPRFGISELVRNSPTYRRTVDDFGYYWAINDFMDAQLTVDWRSGARGSEGDPGFLRYKGEWEYNWIDRFLSGQLAVDHERLRSGLRNTSVHWGHRQAFSQRTNFNANINYVTNTAVQRQTTTNVFQPISSIGSSANFQSGAGPLNYNLGGSRTQSSATTQVTTTFPTFSVNTNGPLELARWLVWTPSLSGSNTVTDNVPSSGTFFRPNASGGADSTRGLRDTRNSTASFSTPIRIFDFNWNNSFALNETEEKGTGLFEDYRTITPAGDTIRERRFVGQRFLTSLNWDTSIELPRFAPGRLNLVPSLSIQNVDPGAGFAIRSNRSGGRWVQQSKRLSYGLSSSPTIYGLFRGFGPISRFRHAITPGLTWSYSPDASGRLDPEFLEAFGRQQTGNLFALAQNRVTLSLSQNIEAKLRGGADTSADGGRKIKLLSLNFSSLSYDFVRADTVGNGFVDQGFSYSARSDVLPGFDLRVRYSLFAGDVNSDTARFSPYREGVEANFSLNRNSAIFAWLGRFLGMGRPSASEIETDQQGSAEQALVTTQVASQSVAGSAARTSPLGVPTAGQGWNASIGYSASRPRPIPGAILLGDSPEIACRDVIGDPRRYNLCLVQQQAAQIDTTTSGGRGGAVYQAPRQTNVSGTISFNLTPKWAVQWITNYDAREKEFGVHQVSLQRELHDWRAIFGFTQSPTGAFSFNFFIALNAQPDLKFDYQRRSYGRDLGR